MERLKIDKGVFSFMTNKGLHLSEMRRILALYALKIHGIKRPNKVKAEFYVIISELAQQDFKGFKKFFSKNVKVQQSYSDWWDECNLDGSFAYNGVTEDF